MMPRKRENGESLESDCLASDGWIGWMADLYKFGFSEGHCFDAVDTNATKINSMQML